MTWWHSTHINLYQSRRAGLEHYEKAVEEGRMHLDDVRLAIQNSPESTDYQVRERPCVCVCEREREREGVWVCVFVVWVCVCVGVCMCGCVYVSSHRMMSAQPFRIGPNLPTNKCECVCAWPLMIQGGEDLQDTWGCRSIFAKEPPIIWLFCGKWPLKIRHPMGLRHPVRHSTGLCHPVPSQFSQKSH